MFGSLGGSEVIFIFLLALLLFGPRRLPEIGRTLGKALGEFRKATQDFRVSLEREVELDKFKDAARTLESTINSSLARGAIEPPAAPPAPATPPAPTVTSDTAAPAASEAAAPDGGSPPRT